MILTADSQKNHHYLGDLDGLLFNGAIYILAKIIKSVMQSAAEAECGAL